MQITGGIILIIIGAIFLIDAYLFFFKGGSKATISYWFYTMLKKSRVFDMLYITAFIGLTAHFLGMGQKKK